MILGMFEMFGGTRFSENEHDYIQYSQNYICHSYAVILSRSACLSRSEQIFPGMFDSQGFAMFDSIGMLIFVFYYICNDYEKLVCEKDAFHIEHTYYFSCKISSGLVYIS